MSKEFEDKVLKCFENIDERFKSIDKKFDRIDQRFEKIDERFDEMDSRFDKIDEKLEEHTEQINNLQESVILLENKVMTELPALFEAFELHLEIHKDYDEKNSYLSSMVEENSMRLSVLEDQIKFINN